MTQDEINRAMYKMVIDQLILEVGDNTPQAIAGFWKCKAKNNPSGPWETMPTSMLNEVPDFSDDTVVPYNIKIFYGGNNAIGDAENIMMGFDEVLRPAHLDEIIRILDTRNITPTQRGIEAFNSMRIGRNRMPVRTARGLSAPAFVRAEALLKIFNKWVDPEPT